MKKNSSSQDERRRRERIQFLRPIVYACNNSDRFIEATMLNHCQSGICFQSTPPLTPGSKIYIMTEETAFDPSLFRGNEAIHAKVMWCERRCGAHWVGVQYITNTVAYDAEQWGASAFASFEFLPAHE